MRYTRSVIEVRQTPEYADWFTSLRDRLAKARIDIRVRRLSLGNPGDESTRQKDVRKAKTLARNLEEH